VTDFDPEVGLAAALGIAFEEMTPDRVVATMPVTPRHLQPFGYLHGGANVVLAETVASVGGNLAAEEGQAVFGLEINANHVRPKRDGMLWAVGERLHRGRTTQIWQIRIEDEDGRLVSIARCTLAVVAAEE
jgi:1,4-dihydroxy-2-naphthoyl-CoA hydrolase